MKIKRAEENLRKVIKEELGVDDVGVQIYIHDHKNITDFKGGIKTLNRLCREGYQTSIGVGDDMFYFWGKDQKEDFRFTYFVGRGG